MDVVSLDVGGVLHRARRSTLCAVDSFFAGLMDANRDDVVFVDRDPTHFQHVLNWMRGCPMTTLPDNKSHLWQLRAEADFYCLPAMVQAIDRRLEDIRRDERDQILFLERVLCHVG